LMRAAQESCQVFQSPIFATAFEYACIDPGRLT